MIKKHLSEDIPEFLYNHDTNEPFSHCKMCGFPLEDKEAYAIEKVFKQNKKLGIREIVYEYAICMDCAGGVQDEISEESMQSLKALYDEFGLQMFMKLEYLHSTEKYNIESWTEKCSFTGKDLNTCSEFSVSAIVEGGKLVYEHAPIAVSDDFMELMQERLSKKTRDYFDGFKDEFFDLPPELKDLINGPTVGII
ncbi:MAG: hypothetical protein JXR19_01785 [Bacteroidia bacterium]